MNMQRCVCVDTWDVIPVFAEKNRDLLSNPDNYSHSLPADSVLYLARVVRYTGIRDRRYYALQVMVR